MANFTGRRQSTNIIDIRNVRILSINYFDGTAVDSSAVTITTDGAFRVGVNNDVISVSDYNFPSTTQIYLIRSAAINDTMRERFGYGVESITSAQKKTLVSMIKYLVGCTFEVEITSQSNDLVEMFRAISRNLRG